MPEEETSEPSVKCAECGFLVVLRQEDGEPIPANRTYRKEGLQAFQRDMVFVEPHCFVGAQQIQAERMGVEGKGYIKLSEAGGLVDAGEHTEALVLSVIQKKRICSSYTPWQQGFTPKEHRELVARELLMKREDQRDREMREREDKRDWREFKQRIVFGIISFAAGAAVAILAALISRN